MNNTEYWEKLRTPPQDALKKIIGGRMKGKSDIDPQWRLEAMTEVFGPIGIGWYYETTKKWLQPGEGNEVCAFVDINLYIKVDGEWSKPISGTGGNMFAQKERSGIYINDECYKMATTDALSVAMKQLGVAADVYRGRHDGSRHNTPTQPTQKLELRPENKSEWMMAIERYQEHGNLNAVEKVRYISPENKEKLIAEASK